MAAPPQPTTAIELLWRGPSAHERASERLAEGQRLVLESAGVGLAPLTVVENVSPANTQRA